MPGGDIAVAETSAGEGGALRTLVSGLPKDLPGSFRRAVKKLSEENVADAANASAVAT